MESTTLTFQQTKSIAPAAAWIGGKSHLAKAIAHLISKIPHILYAEAFVGMGNVFFRRGQIAQAEVINDASGDVANFFRILERHYPQFMDCLKFQITSRAAFDRLVRTAPETLTDLERAARFLYLQNLTFGGKVSGRTFGVQTTKSARFDINKLGPRLEDLHERLARVVIENMDFEDFIRRYDRPHALFYLDPPYWGTEGYYGKELFCRADFERMAACLSGLHGAFILSLNDCPEVRQTFAGFSIGTMPTIWSASGKVTPVEELIITNRAEILIP